MDSTILLDTVYPDQMNEIFAFFFVIIINPRIIFYFGRKIFANKNITRQKLSVIIR